MKSSGLLTFSCRHCRFYSPQGRRGGHCGQLNVPVQSHWKACSLATRIFEPAWEFSGIPVWQNGDTFTSEPIANQTAPLLEASTVS